MPTSGTAMIFGHLPAGYITSKLLFKRFEKHNLVYKEFMFWGMLGAIAPDADLLYYYTIDDYHHPHHTYLTHLPFFWVTLFLISLLWLHLRDNHSQNQAFAVIFTLSGCIHMVLDTFTGNVFWLAPVFSTPFSFVSTDLEYNSWELNYFTHWTFVLELCIVWWAVFLRFRTS
jgi:inner membrane protein